MNKNELYITSVKSKISQGFSILFVREFSLKLLALLGQIIMARLLSPSDFGFYVMIIFIINIFLLFSDCGLSYAIIRNTTEPTDIQLSTTFFFKFFLSLLITLLVLLFASAAKILYPTLTGLQITMLRVSTIIFILTSLRAVPIALLERHINYKAISIVDICGVTAYYFCAIVLALFGVHLWSLIIATVTKEVIEVIVVFILLPWLPKAIFELNAIKHMISFGFFVQWNGLLNFLSTGLIPVMGGILTGPYNTGILSWASNLATTPDSAISNNFGRVAFSGFARLQNDFISLSYAIERSISIMSVITFLIVIMILGYGSELIALLFTHQWLIGIPALYWFASITVFSSVLVPLGQGILVIGKSRLIFIGTLLSNIISWFTAMILYFQIGYLSIAIASFLGSIFLFIWLIYLGKKLGFSIHYVDIILSKVIIMLATIFLDELLFYLLPYNMLFLMIKISITLLFYVLALYMFNKSDLRAIVRYLGDFFQLPFLIKLSDDMIIKNN